MPRFIIKLSDEITGKDYYIEWSTVVDAPVTYGVSLEDFKEYYKNEYGNNGMKGFDSLIEETNKSGTSSPYYNLQSLLDYNRAGENDKTLDKESILEKYCRNWK